MKKTLLTLSLMLIICCSNAQQQTNFYATLFYNSTNNTITTTYYINNTANGNCNMKIAVLPLEMQWNPAVLTLQSFTFIPAGDDLDIWGEEFASKPDANTILSDKNFTVNGNAKTFSRRFYRRSTNLCDNTLDLPCGAYMPVFQAVFTIPAALGNSGYYNFTTPSAANYIGEFIATSITTPSNEFKELTFVANRLFDQAGSNSTCPPGATVGSVNNVPNDQGGEIFVNTDAPLPVTLRYFEVHKQNNTASLKWETASEVSNKGFEIQRKINNGFETVGFVSSRSNGAEQNISYEYNDPLISGSGVIYYRLKQISYLGKEGYSDIKAIRSGKALQVLIYPNPSNGKINIILPDGSGMTDINMIDFSGKLIKSWNGFNIPNIELNGLQKGFYTLIISNRETGEKVSQKITVQ
ncbi:MAG: T9SS type A sorting domain-containing protein [Sphingobacteriales bacterium]|nr:T9SS type A sorting domain-containing protein [Sphingobacteriales bacterium]